MTSGPADVPATRPACARRDGRGGGEELEHVAPVDRLRAVLAPGGQRRARGRRSIRRTRKRNERERAPTTIEARSATESGAAVQQRLLDRQPRLRGGARARRRAGAGRRGRRSAARPPRRAASANFSACAALGSTNGPRRPLHRVDQVVGDLDAVERPVEARAGRSRRRARARRPATVHSRRRSGRSRGRRARRASRRGTSGDADVARDAGDEERACAHMLTGPAASESPEDAGTSIVATRRKCALTGLFAGSTRESLRFAGCLRWRPCSRARRFDRRRPVTES